MSSLWTDIRFVARSIRRAPLFASLVILTLAIGIGATSALFSVVYGVLLAPPPYPEPDRLVMLWEKDAEGNNSNVGYLTFDDARREARAFSSMSALSNWQPVVRVGDESQRLTGDRVTHEFFATLGVHPMLGRDFTAEDDRMATRTVVILSHDVWKRLFNGDPSIVGRAVPINGTSQTVIGVMGPDFVDYLAPMAEIWAPLGYDASVSYACRTCRHLRAVGRVRSGITMQAAEKDLDGVLRSLKERYPTEYGVAGAVTQSLQESATGNMRPALMALFGAVALLLLLACANVANLYLGRTGERQAELSVRMALGAVRSRLVRLVTLEALALSAFGGSIGVLAAWGGTRALVDMLHLSSALRERISAAPPVMLCALALTTLSALAGGTLPALFAIRDAALGDIRMSARSMVGNARHRLRNTVVIGEVALALLLLVGAGLQLRSLARVLGVRTGFTASGVLTMELSLTGARYSEDVAVRTYYRRLLENARAIPGVQSVAVTSQLTLGGNFDSFGIHREDKPALNPEDDPSAQRFAVSPDYLNAMRIAVTRGRGFTVADREGSDLVVLINQSMAKTVFAGEDPIGKRVKMGGTDYPWRMIVGVVEDVKHLTLEKDVENQIYLPFDQNPYAESGMIVVARTSAAPTSVIAPLTRAARGLDPDVAVARVRSMDDVVGTATQGRRIALSMVGAFALVALLLATGGLYGVVSASVTERTREMGLRAALGASPVRLLRLVVSRAAALTVAGIGIGVAGVLAAQRLIAGLLFQVAPSDPVTLGAVALLLGLVALVACIVPASRAARVDPMVALRE
jgi:putative ABC transport system permease protein